MLKFIILAITFVSLCLLTALLNMTTPATAGPLGILLIFLFTYLSSLGVMTFLIYWGSRLFVFILKLLLVSKPIDPLSIKHSYYYSTVIAAVPVLLMGLQSVGAVGIYEYLLLIVFVVVGCLYVSKKI